MDERLEAIIARVRERFPGALGDASEDRGEVSVDVDRGTLGPVARHLKDEEGFDLLVDWSAVDHLGHRPDEQRFLCAAHVHAARGGPRLRLRVWLPEGDETCPSLTGVWPAAGAQEREMFDFFGIRFEGHPDLRRIFMPEEWEGHPQRKDYPLGGTNVTFAGGQIIPPPDIRRQGTTTTGYPGRIS